MENKCQLCFDYLELDSTQCFLCKQYFCYGCLLVRGDSDTHTKSAKSEAPCAITAGELKR